MVTSMQAKQAELVEKIMNDMDDIFGVYSFNERRKFKRDKSGVPIRALGGKVLTREQRLMIAMNWGNESSRQAVLEDAVHINEHFVEARQELIGLLYRQASIAGRARGTRSYDQALDIYQKIVELDPSEVDAWQWIGQIQRSFLDDPEAALAAYQKAYELESDVGILAEIKTLEDEIENMKLENQ